MIKAAHLTRKYGNFTAVDDVSFEVPKGQIVGLLGHNGAGKTTILKMLTGYLEPHAGEISVGPLTLHENRLIIQKKIGYLPENSPVYGDMTVVGYLHYAAKLRQVEDFQIQAAVERVVSQTHLQEKACAKISTLSKGFRQRVGVAQALLHNPEIIILDEPTSGLDPLQIFEMRSLIKELSQNAAVLLSTHILQEVEALCDRVLIIMQGRLKRDALLQDLKVAMTMVVRLDQKSRTALPVLKRIKGVENVQTLGAEGDFFAYRLTLAKSADLVGPNVARTVVLEGWQLQSVELERPSLERVFEEVSTGQVSPSP